MSAYPRYSKILGNISVVILFILTYFVFTSTDPYPPLISLNISILLTWMAFGTFGGSAVSLFCAAVILVFELKTGISGYPIIIISFFASTIVGYFFTKKINKLHNSFALKLEKSEEAMILSGNAIAEKKRELSSFTEKLKRYSTLKEAASAFSASLSLDAVCRLIIDRSQTTLGKPGRILLFLVDTEKQELMLSASHGSSRVKAKQGDILDHWVLRHRKSLIIEDIMKDFRFPLHDEDVSKETFRSMISAPLVCENKVIGVLRMDSPAEAAYTQDDLRLLDILSYLGALAVQNSYLYSRTQELATKDSLTGLAVRRYFTERLKDEIKRAARRGTKLAVLMLDIDRFKDYNDRYGHLSGDLVLKHLSNIVSRSVRKDDVVARYGGEEFVILMLDRDKADALAEAEEIRKKIKDSPLKLRRQDANITVSIGVSSYPEDAGLVEELVRIADDRLYRAKAGGRDKVC